MNKIEKILFIMIWSIGLIGCSGSVPESTQPAEKAESDQEIETLFPSELDLDAYSEGMIKSTSLWKAEKDLPLFTRDEGGRDVVSANEKINEGEEFRILFPATFPLQDADSEKVYGYLPDKQKYVLIYDQNLKASLINGAEWDGKSLIQRKQNIKLYDQIDGKNISANSEQQIFKNFDSGEQNMPWLKTNEGCMPLYDEKGPTFFSVINGIVVGNFARSTTMKEVYDRIVMMKQFDVYKGTFSWGYALANLSDSECPALLIVSGAYNKDLKIEVYGDSSNVITSQSIGSFSMEDSILYQNKDHTLLRFQNVNGQKTVTKISSQNSELKETALTQDKIAKLDFDNLKEIQFTNVYDPSGLDSLKQYIAGNLYPDFDFENHGYVNPSLKKEWLLNYDMTIREEPDRNSKKIGNLSKGEKIKISDIVEDDSESWGNLTTGGWVCLKDIQYDYADPMSSNAKDWKTAYKEILDNEANKEKYANILEYAPLWYLWQDSGFDVPVLAVKTGICEADYILKLYVYKDDSIKKIGETSASHAGFYSTENSGVFERVMGHMGTESVDRITVTANDMEEENLSSRQDVLDYYKPDGQFWEFQNVEAFE